MKPSQINLAEIKLYGVLDAQSFKKIFPEQYFTKFAAHLKVLDFEKKIFQIPPQPGKLKFTKRQNKSIISKPQQIKPKTHISTFAKVNDTILNDKEQIIRFKAFSKKIQENITNPEYQSLLMKSQYSNEIKTFSNKEQIQMKVIDDMMIQSTRETEEKIKQKIQRLKKKQIFCNFTKRDSQQEGRNAYKSRLQWASMKKFNSESKIIRPEYNKMSPQISKKLSQKSLALKSQYQDATITQQKQKTTYLQVPNQMNQQKMDRKWRSNSFAVLNAGKKRIKSHRKVNSIERSPIKIDWIEQTKKLKQNKHLLKKILFTEEIGNLSWKKVTANNNQSNSNLAINQISLQTIRN